MARKHDTLNSRVIQTIAAGLPVQRAEGHGESKWWIGDDLVHVKTCGKSNSDQVTYRFNINPNSSDADWEVLICGRSAAVYYVLPQRVILHLYRAKGRYLDNTNPGTTIFHIDTQNDLVRYSRDLGRMCISQFRCCRFVDPDKVARLDS